LVPDDTLRRSRLDLAVLREERARWPEQEVGAPQRTPYQACFDYAHREVQSVFPRNLGELLEGPVVVAWFLLDRGREPVDAFGAMRDLDGGLGLVYGASYAERGTHSDVASVPVARLLRARADTEVEVPGVSREVRLGVSKTGLSSSPRTSTSSLETRVLRVHSTLIPAIHPSIHSTHLGEHNHLSPILARSERQATQLVQALVEIVRDRSGLDGGNAQRRAGSHYGCVGRRGHRDMCMKMIGG
jgi:hypothetical protein